MTPSGGKLIPLMNRNTLAVKAKRNLPMTSSRSIKSHRKKLVIGGGEGQQRHTARSFDGGRQQALMPGAVSGNPARRHLSSLGYELRNGAEIFVIDLKCLIGAKTAYFAPKHRPAARTTFIVIRSFAARPRAPFKLCHIKTTSFADFGGYSRALNNARQLETHKYCRRRGDGGFRPTLWWNN